MTPKQKHNKKEQLIKRDGPCCCWCKKEFPKDQLTLEHLIPRSLKGSNSLENLKLACQPCNRLRGNRPFPPGYIPDWPDLLQLSPLLVQLKS